MLPHAGSIGCGPVSLISALVGTALTGGRVAGFSACMNSAGNLRL